MDFPSRDELFDIVKIRDHIIEDPSAIDKWPMVVDHIVPLATDVHKLKELMRKYRDYAEAVLQSISILKSSSQVTAWELILVKVLRDLELNSTAEKILGYMEFKRPSVYPSTNRGPPIGIDLGTTNSCVAVFKNGRPEVIPCEEAGSGVLHRLIPSCLAFTDSGEILVGQTARNQQSVNPRNTIFDVKRLIGREWNDPVVQADVQLFPFKVVEKDTKPHIQVTVGSEQETKLFTPEDISTMLLSKIKDIAEAYLQQKVTHAVVTVPAYFNNAQRAATVRAMAGAGLSAMEIVNEPTAAAMAYGFDKFWVKRTILAYDLGGGTVDVSLLRVDDGIFEVVTTTGNTHLGGEDFDQRVVDYFISTLDKGVTEDKVAVQRLRQAVEKAKRSLSSEAQVIIEVESLFNGQDFRQGLTRDKFEELNMDLFQSTMTLVANVLEDAKMSVADVDEVILVGGSTRIPKIQNLVKEFFENKEPSGINPDEAVACGAAVQAAIHSSVFEASEMIVVDVNPLTVGLETLGGVMTVLIPRYSNIPVQMSKLFTTSEDNQRLVRVQIYEGEHPLTKHNHLLGKFDLIGIPPQPRGDPRIEVTFKIDKNGILQVSAEEKGTGNIQTLTIASGKGWHKPPS